MGIRDFAISYVVFTTLHFFLFALALATCGLYGTDVHHANQQGKYSDSKWYLQRSADKSDNVQVYAVVVGSISAVTCVLYFIPFILRIAGIFVPVWDFILFVLWIALFGVFGKMYIDEDAEGDGDIRRMKNAVWVDLASALLWFITALAAFGYWWKHRDHRSRFTGRAHV
ncbi:membrane-associating domain-containing protein [Fusarium flagelliforme]|uniref:Membrane-associating domain-containing protein n=1 Tax=Fusarium flagelliforme TaxID=2675880 RepID=A0A395MAL2_9HYPO|nr:membrane-associating domain-containing protein [Fusarium flagelliforme]